MKQDSLPGIRILGASRGLAGPLCGQLLGDLCVAVLTVERPGDGRRPHFGFRERR